MRVRRPGALYYFKHFSAEAVVVARYNETRHLRTQAALSKLSTNVAQNLEAMLVPFHSSGSLAATRIIFMLIKISTN